MRFPPHATIFFLSLAIFAVIHATPGFGDPDAWYHLAIAKRTAAFGPVSAFPWLPFTTLAGHYADQHFLYHVALIPFLNVFGDFYGLKIATIVFAALAMVVFAWMLGVHGVRRPWLWTLPLLVSTGFLFRLLLTKATGLALATFLAGLGFLKLKNRPALFLIAFAYVWLHGSWPIFVLAAFAHAVLHREWRSFLAVLFGAAAGFIVNPFFPHNALFAWEQIVQIAVIGNRDPGVQVGNEWQPVDLGWLLVENAMVFFAIAATFVTLALMIRHALRPPEISADRRRDIVFAAALASVFLCLTLRQARHKEYFLPLALWFGALLGDAIGVETRATLERVHAWAGRWFRPLLVTAMAVLAFLSVHGVWYAHRLYATRAPFSRYEHAGAWMQEYVPSGETIFHAAWDDFPALFYHDPSHRYIAGLDALFLYRKDPAAYWLWRDIGDGRRHDPPSLILQNFGARYVFVNPKRDRFFTLLKNDPSMEQIYADEEAEIWKIK